MNRELLAVSNLSKSYGEFNLKNISIKIYPGEIVGLIGKNGAGKTTLINCIMGLVDIEKGDILMFGEKYGNTNYRAKEKIGIAFDTCLFPEELTAEDIDKTMKYIYKKWDTNYFFRLLSKFQLPKKKKIKSFSSGMKMMLSFIVSLSHLPSVLFYDEVTNGLDPEKKLEALTLMKEYSESQEAAILMSSHMINDMEKICNSFIFISDGEIMLQGTKAELLEKYKALNVSGKNYNQINQDALLGQFINTNGELVIIVQKDKYLGNLDLHDTNIEDIALAIIKGASIC